MFRTCVPAFAVMAVIAVGGAATHGQTRVEYNTRSELGSEGSQVKQEVLRAKQEFDDAALRNDADGRARFYADDYIAILYDGTVADKETQLQRVRSGALRFSARTIEELRIRVFGNTALVTERRKQQAIGESGPRPTDVRVAELWAKSEGSWKLQFTQITQVPSQPDSKPKNASDPQSGDEASVRDALALTVTEREILNIEAKRRHAILDGDAGSLNSIIADDFIEVTGGGTIRRKSENIEDLRTGRLKFVRYEVGEEHVRLFNSFAIYSARIDVKGTLADRPFGGAARSSRTYVSRDGRWLCVYAQNTPLNETGTAGEPSPFSSAESTTSLRQTITENLIRNDRVHVSRITHAPAQHVRMHYAPSMTIIFHSDAHFAWLWPDGKREEVSYKFGDAAWFPGGLHASESLDDHEQHMMLVVPVDDPDPARAQGDPFTATFAPADAATARPGAQSITFSRDGDWQSGTLRVLTNNGEARTFAYRAKFDDKEYPYVEPANLTNTVSLHRIDRRAFTMTERRDGKVVAVYTRVLSADGKTLTNCRWQVGGQGNETTHIETLQRESK